MTAPSSTVPPPAPSCAVCGTAVTGRFCGGCGAEAFVRPCRRCGATPSPGARFCHRCGAAAGRGALPRRERRLWAATAGLLVLSVVFAVLLIRSDARPVPPPAMGAAGGAAPALTGRAPDISTLTPRQRFDRLYDRVMRAADAGDTATVLTFGAHALSAYRQLDSVDADARYHAAILHAQLGDYGPALTLADSILQNQPGHLFTYLIRGTVAELRRDPAALAAARADLLAAWPRDLTGRAEYLDHQQVLREFRQAAEAARGRPREEP